MAVAGAVPTNSRHPLIIVSHGYSNTSAVMPVRHARTQAVTPSAASMAARRVGRCPGLVDEDQSLGVEIELPLEPLLATLQEVGAFLFGGACGAFFRVIW